MSNIPLVILTGHRKSGTSVFHRLFDGVNGINLYPTDLSVLYAYFPCFTLNGNITNNELKIRLIQVVKKSLGFVSADNASAIDIEKFVEIFKLEIDSINLRDKMDVILSIYNAWNKYNNKAVDSYPFIFKETSQSIYFKDYLDKFPKLKMISIVRDPRDNYAAINAGAADYYSKFGEDDISILGSHINRARMDLLSAKINRENYPESFLAIRFEDLVNDTETVMKNISEFLNIEFSVNMLTPETYGVPYRGNNFDGNKFNGLSNKNIGTWSNRVPDSSVKVIEYWIGDIMKYWGYGLDFCYSDSQSEFLSFYERYNCKYFYHDSF